MKTINVILLILGIICTIIGLIYTYKKKEFIEKIMSGIFAIIGLVLSVFNGESIYYYDIINVLNEKIYYIESKLIVENNNDITSAEIVSADNIINSNNQITNNTVFETADSDENTLMNYAKFYYTSNNYEGVARVYGNSKLSTNPIALTNLGYMYANGIFFEQNFEIAENYYNQAITFGFEQALCNKLAMYIKNCLPGIISVLQEGLENRSEKIARFVSSNYYMDRSDLNMAMYYDFSCLSEEKKLEEIDSWYYWDDGVVKTYYETPYPETYAQKIEYIRSFTRDNRLGALYRVYEKHCNNINLLDEAFILQ